MWLRLKDLSIPHGPINNIQQTFEHPQAIARGVVVEVEVRTPSLRHNSAT